MRKNCQLALALAIPLLIGGCFTLDDGPFHGKPTDKRPEAPPRSTIQVNFWLTLETHDALTSDTSAIVLARDNKGEVLWAIEADGHKPGDTKSVVFESVTSGSTCYTIAGHSDWTFGNERTTWQVWPNGSLRAYYNSW